MEGRFYCRRYIYRYIRTKLHPILLLDEVTISRWYKNYEENRWDGLKNDPNWGGDHGQRELSAEQLEELKRILREDAMPGTKVGSGWTNKAVRQLIADRFEVEYGKSGMRKVFARIGWSYQRGRKLYHRLTAEDQARYEMETCAVLEKYAQNGKKVVPLASDQSKVYLEGTLSRRWSPVGQQPLVEDGARQKKADNLYGAVHLGTGAEVAPFAIDWQDSDATQI